jgi:hypothetical protein
MILVVLAGLCVLSVPLMGGRLQRLADLRLRGLWLPIVALALQVLITAIAAGGSPALHRLAQVASYLVLGAFLWLNRRLPGVRVIGLGAAANALAIVANRGIMPASVRAERLSGLVMHDGFRNSMPLAHPRLLWLGDVIPWPGPLPNVLSIGDVVIFAGTIVLLQRTCRRTASGTIALAPTEDETRRLVSPPDGSRSSSRPGSGRSDRLPRGRGSTRPRPSRGCASSPPRG